MKLMLLFVMVIVSALGVVYQKHYSRQLFTKMQQLDKQLDDYEAEWGKLQLEQTTLAGYGRVEIMARKSLGLVLPGKDSVVYVTQAPRHED